MNPVRDNGRFANKAGGIAPPANSMDLNRQQESAAFSNGVKGEEFIVGIINDDEIFAGIHKYKLFRKEGNLFIDVYESLIGKPAHKFVAVPNLLFQESDKEYFGFGDTKADAIKDCLEKVKDVPIETIVPPENSTDHDLTSKNSLNSQQEAESSTPFWKSGRIFSRGKK